MRLIVDTTALSLAMRRRPAAAFSQPESAARQQLLASMESRELVLVGPVRLEVLSGIRSDEEFDALRLALRAFPDEPLVAKDFEEGARFANLLVRRGVQSTSVDMLICSVAARLALPVLTLDRDFPRYADHLPITLYSLS